MYDELLKRLREAAISAYSGNEISDSLYRDILQAADAIAKLGKDFERSKVWETFWEKEANEALKKFQTTVASMPHWIPVEERLPEEPGEYTVFIKDPFHKREDEDFISFDGSYVTNAFYDKDAGLWQESQTSFYCANLSCVNTEKIFYITHWMPLPEPPKEVNADGQ